MSDFEKKLEQYLSDKLSKEEIQDFEASIKKESGLPESFVIDKKFVTESLLRVELKKLHTDLEQKGHFQENGKTSNKIVEMNPNWLKIAVAIALIPILYIVWISMPAKHANDIVYDFNIDGDIASISRSISGDEDEIKKNFDEAIELFNNKNTNLFNNKNTEEAISLFENCLSKLENLTNPTQKEDLEWRIKASLACALLSVNQSEKEAEQYLLDVKNFGQKNEGSEAGTSAFITASYNLGLLYKKQKNLPKAKAAFLEIQGKRGKDLDDKIKEQLGE